MKRVVIICGMKHASYVYCLYHSLNLFTYLDSHLQYLKANHFQEIKTYDTLCIISRNNPPNENAQSYFFHLSS